MTIPTFTAGSVLTASQMNSLAKQVVVTCTSGTRPSSPPEGMTIYETDTDKMLTYVSATTGWVPPCNKPWGVVTATSGGTSGYGYCRITTAQNGVGTSATDVTNATVTFTAVANRLYRVTASADLLQAATATEGQIQLLVDGTAYATSRIGITTTDRFAVIATVLTLSAGSHTLKLQAQAISSGTLNIQAATNAPIMLAIEDAGPVGAPA